jgi:hypothetical protein
MFSYSSIVKNAPVEIKPEPVLESEVHQVIEEPQLNRVDRVIMPKIIKRNYLYTRWNTVKWLCYRIDENFYNYDYCYKLFEMLMKWVRINGLEIRIPEHVLFAKFISFMYLVSDKKCIKSY